MAAASKSGMELAPMKQLLNKAAPDNPIPFAFGIGAEPGFALLMLDKAGKNPKGVLKSLEDEFKDAKNTRWGTAVVEPERASLVKFIVNKPVSGMAKRLVKTLKGTGYNKAEIVLEDGTVVEGAADEEEGVLAGAEATAPTVPGGPPAPPPPPPAGATPEEKAKLAAALEAKLKALIPRIGPAGATNPELLAQLKKFATDANVNIKTGNLVYANVAITQLATALDKVGTATAPTGGAVAYGKARLIWTATHQKVVADIEKLRAELVATYQAEGLAGDVEKRYSAVVAPLMDTLDDSLADKLDEVTNATDPALRTQLVAEAREIITRYTGVLSNPVVADLDTNPFVPMSIQKTLSATLTGLSAAVR
jgi:hypothetical protein